MDLIENNTLEMQEVVREKVVEFGNSSLPSSIDTLPEASFGCYLYNDEEKVVGGITAHSFWNIMHIDFFWVDESLRGQGQGKKLLIKMEEIAKREKCNVIHLETFSFEAPRFYAKNGYQEFGKIGDVPVSGCDYFFFKKEI
ncbi:GNAT family N-acetyltransferase [Enterococcus pseudoavium]|uniref:GNAT family N-acetyltransferase n=1 Tax=Enterococcus pseudoavium TaxID=44007 RepID=A0ABU3FGQ1_9ENTE|nr:GNAT family N-acetyltransferase [Enterococcus pseudoavium]MDT2754932.1 GNAT family N-acetyltransferase [Enterococcus pseudoavium]MDT2770228.1 GNAT family N-acetyltransferase [Enterococcus pseudoavium]